MAALGEMTLKAVMGALSLVLGPHWAVSDEEARHWGRAFEAWLKAQPPRRRKTLSNALSAVPTLNLVVATGMVLAPRVQATMMLAKEAKRGQGRVNQDAGGTSVPSGPSGPGEPPSWADASAVKKLYEQYAGTAGAGNSGDPGPNGEASGSRTRA